MQNDTYRSPDGAFSTDNPVLAAMQREADGIQAFLGIPLNMEDPAAMTYRLRDLDVYLARLSDMMIRAKTLRDSTKYSYIQENEDRLNKLSATISNRQMDSFLLPFAATYNRLETMYHTTEVLSRNLVTQISYIKKQMECFGG